MFPKGKYFVTSCSKVCILEHYLHQLYKISFLSELIASFFKKKIHVSCKRVNIYCLPQTHKTRESKTDEQNIEPPFIIQLCHQNGKLVKLLTVIATGTALRHHQPCLSLPTLGLSPHCPWPQTPCQPPEPSACAPVMLHAMMDLRGAPIVPIGTWQYLFSHRECRGECCCQNNLQREIAVYLMKQTKCLKHLLMLFSFPVLWMKRLFTMSLASLTSEHLSGMHFKMPLELDNICRENTCQTLSFCN